MRFVFRTPPLPKRRSGLHLQTADIFYSFIIRPNARFVNLFRILDSLLLCKFFHKYYLQIEKSVL